MSEGFPRPQIALLRCPHCAGGLEPGSAPGRPGPVRSLGCAAGHRFDVARQGYVNLLPGPARTTSDTTAMVAARARFLDAGAYAGIADALAERARGRTVVEAGAGTGHYLARVLDALPDAVGIACDLSVPAVRRAARAHPRLAAVVADTWAGLPLADGAAEVVLCVFAPRNLADFARLLAPGGRLLVVIPEPDHLAGLRERLGLLTLEAGKRERLLSAAANAGLTPVGQTRIAFETHLDAGGIDDLIAMGPNAFHSAHSRGEAGAVQVAVRLLELRLA